MASPRAYVAVTITLADTDGVQRLYDLCLAIDPDTPLQASAIQIQASDLNGANPLAIGDLHLSATRCGIRLLVHEGQPEKHNVFSGLAWSDVYVLNPTAGTTIYANVEIWA